MSSDERPYRSTGTAGRAARARWTRDTPRNGPSDERERHRLAARRPAALAPTLVLLSLLALFLVSALIARRTRTRWHVITLVAEPARCDAARARRIAPVGERGREVTASATELMDPLRTADLPEVIGCLLQARLAAIQRTEPGSATVAVLAVLFVLVATALVARLARGYHSLAQQRLELLEALTESEERFRQIAENLHDVIWLGDPHFTTHLYVNAAYERVWGRSRQSLYDHPDSWLEGVHPEDQARVAATASAALTRGIDMEFRVVRPDGEIRWVWMRAFPVWNEHRVIYRMVGITEDITARKLAELERERRRAELERVMESRARLIRGFTHDVKNPLGAADGSLALLEGKLLGALTPEQLESVRRVRRSIRAALDLIGQLLELARAEAGQLEIRREPVDVRATASELAEEFQAQAEAKGLTLVVDVSRDVPEIASDRARVRQILANLVANAIAYTPARGRVTVLADVRSSAAVPGAAPGPGEWVVVEVTDTGPGIPAELQGVLFEEFTRLYVDAVQGAGIGLAISQRVARALGGDVTVASERGVGSTFTLWVPVG